MLNYAKKFFWGNKPLNKEKRHEKKHTILVYILMSQHSADDQLLAT